MDEEQRVSALFTTAFLSTRHDLDYLQRSSIVSYAQRFDIRSSQAIRDGLNSAFRAAGVPFNPAKLPGERQLLDMASKAEQWHRNGIRLLRSGDVRIIHELLHTIPPLLYGKGDLSIAQKRGATILNSRKPRRVTPGDGWIIATKLLFALILNEKCSVISSYGALPYELLARLARVNGSALVVVCPEPLPWMVSPKREIEFLERYRDIFPPDNTLYLSPFAPGGLPPPASRSSERDNLVAALSSSVMIAAVREGGNMVKILEAVLQRDISVTAFVPDTVDKTSSGNVNAVRNAPRGRVQTVGSGEHRVWSNAGSDSGKRSIHSPNKVLRLRNWPKEGEFLIHYTRSCHGPWPGQSLGQYCQSLIDGQENSGHTGFDTLLRILEEKRIRSGAKFVRGPAGCVSFTECSPAQLKILIKWRKGLIRWSFEPYGIGIKKELLVGIGAVKVTYGYETVFEGLSDDRKFLFQLQTDRGDDWSLEKEWRVKGDVHCDKIPAEDIVIIVPSLDEARIVQNLFQYEVTLVDPENSRHL